MLPTKAVAYNDIHMILEQIMSLDVADEIQIEMLAKFEGFERQFVALAIFRADAQIPTRGFSDPALRVNKYFPSRRICAR